MTTQGKINALTGQLERTLNDLKEISLSGQLSESDSEKIDFRIIVIQQTLEAVQGNQNLEMALMALSQ